MLPSNRVALKEWAIVVRAVGQGSQILLLRKGGIDEQRAEFQLHAREFFLYPTCEHQQAGLLQPQFQDAFGALADHETDGAGLRFEYYAVATDLLPAPELSRMKQLSDAFVWNDAFLEKRYGYQPQLPLYILLLKAYRLSQPVRLPMRERYAGCHSWVELEDSLSTEGAVPVLPAGEFERRREALRRRLL
jgi:hypothetical protein